LRVAVALSGGSYRAALVHAGVLQELAAHGVPVTNIASVSGGSIIAAFLARGGDPADFVDAVKDGRFRLKRELLSAFTLPRWLLPVGSYSRRDVQASLLRRVLLAADPPPARARPALMLAMTDLRRGLSVGATENGYMLAGPTTSRFFRTGEAIVIEGLGDLANIVAVSGAFPGAFPALQSVARMTMVAEPLLKSRDSKSLDLALVDGGVRDNLGLKLLQAIDQEARGTGNTSLSWPGFRPGPEWALDVVIVSDGGQSFDAAEGSLGLLAQTWRAIELAGLETGILRPILLSSDLPIISLSIAAELGLSPDAEIVQSAMRPHASARRDVLRSHLLTDQVLDRIVELLPSREKARQALADFKRTRSDPIDVTDIDVRCREVENRDTGQCHWRTLVDLLVDDIDSITGVFRNSATLEDQYSADDADALVRLGRYFVLLKLQDIGQSITRVASR
jgi:predicted acylesterase/phospholipase RssA